MKIVDGSGGVNSDDTVPYICLFEAETLYEEFQSDIPHNFHLFYKENYIEFGVEHSISPEILIGLSGEILSSYKNKYS